MALNIEREEKRLFKNKTVRLPEDVIEKLEKIASEKNISFNKVILKIIEYGIDDVQCLCLNQRELKYIYQNGITMLTNISELDYLFIFLNICFL